LIGDDHQDDGHSQQSCQAHRHLLLPFPPVVERCEDADDVETSDQKRRPNKCHNVVVGFTRYDDVVIHGNVREIRAARKSRD
jgi:hypothetical protein